MNESRENNDPSDRMTSQDLYEMSLLHFAMVSQSLCYDI